MLSETILQRFNPEAKVPLHEYSKYRATLQTYSAFANKGEVKKTDEKVDVDPKMMEVAMEMQEKYHQASFEIQIVLINLFFPGISEDETVSYFDDLMGKIGEAKPGLIDFFYLPKTKTNSQDDTLETNSTEK